MKLRFQYALIATLLCIATAQLQANQTADIPDCAYEDTVNVTSSQKFQNGSYLYEGVLLPPHLIGRYDYEVLRQGVRISVAPHMRGCVCKLKSCIKLCCPRTHLKIDETRECRLAVEDELNYSPYVNITFDDGSIASVHVLDKFVVQEGMPCDGSYNAENHTWQLFENGTLFRFEDANSLSKQDYCLSPFKDQGVYALNPTYCYDLMELSLELIIKGIGMLISILFFFLTILVYLYIPKLRNLHGKCLICYLFSLGSGYTVLVLNMWVSQDMSTPVCKLVGFIGYFFLMSAFFWLSVISFDLWHSFRGTSRCNMEKFLQNRRFNIYSLYAWGFPAIFTGFTLIAQNADLEGVFRPGIGDDQCWLKGHDWSAMIYFFGPNLLIILFNITMFILSARNIYMVKRELERLSEQHESKRHLCTQRDNYGLFLRLFVVMGVTWLLDIISYMTGNPSGLIFLFYLTDMLNALQGFIIFVLFVCKRKVFELIKNRILGRDESKNDSDSTQSDCSADEIPLQDCAKQAIQFVD